MITYTVHPYALSRAGVAKAPVPALAVPLVGQRLALDAASTVINGPCEVRIVADENIWLDMRTSTGALAPAGSPLKLLAGQQMWFEVPAGAHYIMGSAA